MKKKILFIFAFALSIQFVNAQAITSGDILLYLDFEGNFTDDTGNFSFARKTSGNASGAGGNDITYSSDGNIFGQYGVFDDTVYESANGIYNTSNSSTIAVWVRIDDSESIANEMHNKNLLVDEYLADSTTSYWISIFALFLTIALSSYSIFQNRRRRIRLGIKFTKK